LFQREPKTQAARSKNYRAIRKSAFCGLLK